MKATMVKGKTSSSSALRKCIDNGIFDRCAKELSSLPYVYVPKVFWDLTSKVTKIIRWIISVPILQIWLPFSFLFSHIQRVLTTEFIDGIKVSDTSSLEKAGLSIKEVSHKLIETFAEQIFHTGFVHADPHPGNSKSENPIRVSNGSIYLLMHLL